nr:MAG TPA: hypothetical protein [Caudoviricetes sp.]
MIKIKVLSLKSIILNIELFYIRKFINENS